MKSKLGIAPITKQHAFFRAAKGKKGWFVVEAEQDPRVSPPLDMAKKGRKGLLRVMAAAGYEVVP